MKRVPFYTLAAAAVVLFAMAGQAKATPPSGTVAVSATVPTACKVNNSPSIAFGSFDPTLDPVVDATGTIGIRCTKGTAPKIALDNGGHAGLGGFGTRAMSDGTDNLGYEIYSDTGRSSVWSAAITEPVQTDNLDHDYTMYGRIGNTGNNESVEAGSYTDTVNITVTF